jgi:probable rRNA maturation factor
MNEHWAVPLGRVGPAAHFGRKRYAMRPRRQRPTIDIEIKVDSPLWHKERNAKAVVRRAIAQASSAVALSRAEVSVVLADEAAVRELNRTWRHRDEPTNVLSFPAHPGTDDRPGPRFLGDIVLAYQTLAREASARHKTFAQHLAHLAVHGFLHLVGYDHETDAEATAMELLETMILARLDVPDPYRLRDGPSDI